VSTESKTNDYKYVMHCVIMFSIMALFRFLPAPGTVTEYGMAVAGVFLGLVYGWSFIGLLWPSLLAILMIATTGYGSVTAILTAMFTNSTVLMMLIGCLAFGAVAQTGAGDWLFSKIMGNKAVKKNPMLLVSVILFAWWVGMLAGLNWFLYFAVLPLMADMLLKCGYERGEKFSYYLLAGCMMSCCVGMAVFPFYSWGLMMTGTIMATTGSMVSYGGYMAIMFIFSAVIIAGYPFIMKIVGCDFSKIANANIEEIFPVKNELNVEQKLALFSVAAFIILVVVITVFGNKISFLGSINLLYGVAGLMLAVWAFVVAVKVNGKPLMNMKKTAEDFSWDMLILIAVALFVSNLLTNEATGISGWLAGLLAPILNNMDGVVFLILLAILTTILTNIANNMAICFIMLNLVAVLYNNGFDINLTAASAIIALTSSYVSFLMPGSSLPGALLCACPALTPGSCFKNTIVLAIILTIVLMAVIIPYVLIFG